MLEREPEWERLPHDVPSRLQRLLRRCLTKDPNQRLQAIGDAFLAASVREDDERLQVGSPVTLFEGDYGSSTPNRGYGVSPDGRFLLNRDPEDDAVAAAIEKIFPDRIQVVQGWLAELRR